MRMLPHKYSLLFCGNNAYFLMFHQLMLWLPSGFKLTANGGVSLCYYQNTVRALNAPLAECNLNKRSVKFNKKYEQII